MATGKDVAQVFRAQIIHLLETAAEQLGQPGDGDDDGGAILASETLLKQAAAMATGYRAMASKPGWGEY